MAMVMMDGLSRPLHSLRPRVTPNTYGHTLRVLKPPIAPSLKRRHKNQIYDRIEYPISFILQSYSPCTKEGMAGLRLTLRGTASSLGYVVMNLLTLPYYKFFRQNTLLPILAIANKARLQKSDVELAAMLSSWRDRKLYELYFVQVAGTLVSAAVIACLSWEPRDFEHWIGPAARFCSLVLSLFAILLSASESSIFTDVLQREPHASRSAQVHPSVRDVAMVCHIMKKGISLSSNVAPTQARSSLFYSGPKSEGDDDREKGGGQMLQELEDRRSSVIDDDNTNIEVRIRWNMVFTWQAPIMLLAYSIIAFLVGLTAYVCAPLYSEDLVGREAAILYLVSLAMGGFCFMWCSFWAYKLVDLNGP
ncbi:hypothetical protein K449DRAFT_395771 [Hypoxylon sp. EC38]|nr:hypothetical protein K449DRAFT_395771 [Hypoxylon sp. EC38]